MTAFLIEVSHGENLGTPISAQHIVCKGNISCVLRDDWKVVIARDRSMSELESVHVFVVSEPTFHGFAVVLPSPPSLARAWL